MRFSSWFSLSALAVIGQAIPQGVVTVSVPVVNIVTVSSPAEPSALSSPAGPVFSAVEDPERGTTYNGLTKRQFCNGFNLISGGEAEQRRAWDTTGTGAWLAEFLRTNPTSRWVQTLDAQVRNSGGSSMDCTSVGGDCDNDMSCGKSGPAIRFVSYTTDFEQTHFGTLVTRMPTISSGQSHRRIRASSIFTRKSRLRQF